MPEQPFQSALRSGLLKESASRTAGAPEPGLPVTLQLADPGASVAVRNKNNAVEYLG